MMAGVGTVPSHSGTQSKMFCTWFQSKKQSRRVNLRILQRGILYDAHDRLIGLRRYDLLRESDKSYLEGVGTYLSRGPCNMTHIGEHWRGN